jgi:hypothetical protein
MHEHHALWRAKPVDRSMQPPYKEGSVGLPLKNVMCLIRTNYIYNFQEQKNS